MTKQEPTTFPSPDTVNPVSLPDGSRHHGTVFLKAVLSHPKIEVGEYTYASTFDPPDDWAARLAPHLYASSPERLVIGKFCQLAHAAVFITASANHRYDGFSSFPFGIFGGPTENRPSLPVDGPDTVVGNDVWIGQGATVLPGARIGDGAIIGAGSVVAGAIPDYSVAVGNTAQIVRKRFDDATIARLKAVAWWNWPIEVIVACEAHIVGADIDALEAAHRALASVEYPSPRD